MISETLLIVLLATAAVLTAYAVLCSNPIPFSDLVAMTAADIIMWSAAVLYGSGNVVAEEFVIASTTVTDTVTTYTYQLMQTPVTDVTLAMLFLIGAVCMTLYTLYLIIPTVQEILSGGEVTNV